MNLSLRSSGKAKCEQLQANLFELLDNLLTHENEQVRTFVNGTLYSLFTRQSLKSIARKMKLDEKLKTLMKKSSEKFVNHYSYILKQLQSDQTEDIGSS